MPSSKRRLNEKEKAAVVASAPTKPIRPNFAMRNAALIRANQVPKRFPDHNDLFLQSRAFSHREQIDRELYAKELAERQRLERQQEKKKIRQIRRNCVLDVLATNFDAISLWRMVRSGLLDQAPSMIPFSHLRVGGVSVSEEHPVVRNGHRTTPTSQLPFQRSMDRFWFFSKPAPHPIFEYMELIHRPDEEEEGDGQENDHIMDKEANPELGWRGEEDERLLMSLWQSKNPVHGEFHFAFTHIVAKIKAIGEGVRGLNYMEATFEGKLLPRFDPQFDRRIRVSTHGKVVYIDTPSLNQRYVPRLDPFDENSYKQLMDGFCHFLRYHETRAGFPLPVEPMWKAWRELPDGDLNALASRLGTLPLPDGCDDLFLCPSSLFSTKAYFRLLDAGKVGATSWFFSDIRAKGYVPTALDILSHFYDAYEDPGMEHRDRMKKIHFGKKPISDLELSELCSRDQEDLGKRVQRTLALDIAEAFVRPPIYIDLSDYSFVHADETVEELHDEDYDAIEEFTRETLLITQRLEEERLQKSLPLDASHNPCNRPPQEWEPSGAAMERYLRRLGRSESYDLDPRLLTAIHWRNQGLLREEVYIWCEFEHPLHRSGAARCWVPMHLLLHNPAYCAVLQGLGFSVGAAMAAVRADPYKGRLPWEEFCRVHLEQAQIEDDEEPDYELVNNPDSDAPDAPRAKLVKLPGPSDNEMDSLTAERNKELWDEWVRDLVSRSIDTRSLDC